MNFRANDMLYDEQGFTTTGRDFGVGFIGWVALYFVRHHYLDDISRSIAPGSAVIEIGCGGGLRYLPSRYDMLGVNVSALSVRHAGRTYASIVQATAADFPLMDGCADAIVSNYVLAHLGKDIADRCVGEMARVLRLGGVMAHCPDLDGEGPSHRWAKMQPWYEGIFVTSRAHAGLRRFNEWARLFEARGFRIEARRFFRKTFLRDFSIWGALDSPSVSGIPRKMGRVALAIHLMAGWASAALLTIYDDLVSCFLPDAWASKGILRPWRRS